MNRSIASPLDLSGCVLWLDSLNDASITRDGSNKVSQWSDLSGAGNHPVQGVAGNKPTYVVNAVGSMAAVQFFNAGGGTWLESATGAVTGNSSHTLFVVVRNVDLSLAGLYGGFVSWGSPQTTYNCSDIMANASASPVKWTFGGPGYGLNGSTALAGVTYVATKRYTSGLPGVIVGRVNGMGDQAAQFTLNIGDTKIEIGRSSTFTTRSPDAYLFSVVMFNRALSDGEIVLVERYLAQRYNVGYSLPSDVPSLVAWYQAGQGIHLEGATQKVEQWDDLSGLGHHLLQATTGLKPLLSTMPNGLPAVLFDGVDDLMKATFTLAQPISICAVLSAVVPGVYGVHDVAFAGITSNLSMTLLLGTTPLLAFFLGGNAAAGALILLLAGTNIALTPYNCYSGVLDSVRSSLRVNGATRLSGDAGSSSPGGVSLGAYANGTEPANVSISEMAIYNRVLTEAELLFVERYMITRSRLLAA